MEKIRSLSRLTCQQLFERLVETAETARDAGDSEECKNALEDIEAIIYTLRNCKEED